MKKILVVLAVAFSLHAVAQDRLFTYTYQSSVLNKGQKELEIWTTLAGGREDYYRGIDHRMEFEIGLGSRLQTAFYLNYGYSKGITGPEGAQFAESETEYSFSNEWKLKLTDPVANRLGSAVYFEYTLSPAETELEAKLILDKQTGKFLHAFNLVGEYEIEKEFVANAYRLKPENETGFALELNYGLSYPLKKNLNIGVEAMNQNTFAESRWKNSVLLAGPVVSWTTDQFWVNLSFMPQITNLKGGGLELRDHERYQTRLVFSYVF
jgi:hypothetical protein